MSSPHHFFDPSLISAFQSPSPDPPAAQSSSSDPKPSAASPPSPVPSSSQAGNLSSSRTRKPYTRKFSLNDLPMKFLPETTLGQLFCRLVDTHCQALVTDEICILVLTELGVTFVTDEHIRFIRDRISRRLKLLRRRARQRDTSGSS